MPVDAAESDGGAVEGKDKIPDLNFAETDFFSNYFVVSFHDKRVKMRSLGTPESGMTDGYGDSSFRNRGKRFLIYCFHIVRRSKSQSDRNRSSMK